MLNSNCNNLFFFFQYKKKPYIIERIDLYLGFGDLSSGKSSNERVLSFKRLLLARLLSYRAANGARQLDSRPQLHPALGAS